MSASISQAASASTQSAIAAAARAQITTPVNRLKDDKSSASDTTVNLGQSVKPDLQLYSVAAVKATAKVASTETTGGPTVSAGSVIAGKGALTVDVLASDSRYENKIYYSTDNFKTKHYIGTDNHQASVDIGKFAEGTRIDFAIDNGVGGFYRTGGAAANRDNVDHTQVVKTTNAVNVNFEDTKNGGDRDFNDALIRVRASAPATTPDKPAPSNDNRSGLGDGTNPGAGAGTKNASNSGTANPAGIKIAAATVSVIAAPIPAKLATAGRKPVVASVTASSTRAETISAKPLAVASAAAPSVVKPVTVAKTSPESPVTVAQKPPTLPATAATVANKADAAHINRSGLGDGTNPGHGAGNTNSPNQGVNNPGSAVASVLK